jgi:hypothetical protein
VSIKENTPALECERHSSHKTTHTIFPVDVVEEISHKYPSILTGRQQLGQQISLIFMCADIAGPPFVIGHGQSGMQCSVTSSSVCSLALSCLPAQLIVSTDVAGAIHCDPHHPELISQSSEIFAALLHCNKLRSKRRSLHKCLLTQGCEKFSDQVK